MRFACLGFNVNPAGWAELEWRLLAIVANTKVLHDSRALDTQVEWWPPNDVVICIKIIHSGYCPLQEHVLIALWHDFIWDLGRLWQNSDRTTGLGGLSGYQTDSQEVIRSSQKSIHIIQIIQCLRAQLVFCISVSLSMWYFAILFCMLVFCLL